MKYFENENFIVKSLEFKHRGYSFHGKGFIEWNYNEGFDIKLFIDSNDYKHPKAIGFGGQEIIKSKDRSDINFTFENGSTGFIKDVFLKYHIDIGFSISHSSTIHFKSSRLTFMSQSLKKEKYFEGDALYKITDTYHVFPEIISKTEKIGDLKINEGWSRKGIRFKDQKISLIGWKESNEYFRIKYSLNSEFYSKEFSEKFPLGVQLALSFILGIDVQRLTYSINNNEQIIREVNRVHEVATLKFFQGVGITYFQIFDSELLVKLALFFTDSFTNNNLEAYVSRNILYQIIEAERKGNHISLELLTATILEASLRTLYNSPFIPGSQSNFDTENYLKNNFLPDYANPKEWREARKEVSKSFKKLRHRNAHPDWLLDLEELNSDERISETTHDIRVLLWFYKLMIMLMAGIEDLKPELPRKI